MKDNWDTLTLQFTNMAASFVDVLAMAIGMIWSWLGRWEYIYIYTYLDTGQTTSKHQCPDKHAEDVLKHEHTSE